jgi:mannose-6-phosphate isomerase-like protein (cupin superfamily)
MIMPFEIIPITLDSLQSLIFKMLPVPLSDVPFHNNTSAITRYFAKNLPVHLAVHEVSTITKAPWEYTQLHMHADCDEINIIISQNSLVYKMQLEDEEYIVGSNSAIWIPRDTLHSR